MSGPRLSRSTLWIFFLTLLSRISGFLRTSILAWAFGTGINTDAWVMASAVPSLLFGSVYQGVSVATVPTLADAKGSTLPREAEAFIHQMWTLLLAAGLIMVGVGEIFTPEIIRFLAYGFHGQERAETITMARIMIPSIIFWVSSGFLTGILQSGENFFGLTLSPLVVNLVQIFGIVVLGHWYGIDGVAWGFSLAIAAQLLLLWPLLRRRGVRLKLTRRFDSPRVKVMLRLMGPYLIISSTASVELIIDRMLASSMAHGSISAMNFAFTVSQVPLGLIIAPLVTPIYTRLAVLHAESSRQSFQRLSLRGMRWVLMLTLPLSLALFVLNVPILRAVYERGRFNAVSLHLTSHLFLFAILGLPALALSSYLQQLCFAARNTKRPARYNIIGVLVNIAGNLVLTRYMGVYGLVLATTIAAWTNAVLLVWSFGVRRHMVGQWRFVASLGAGGLAMASVLATVAWRLHLNHTASLFTTVFGVALAAALAASVYGALLLALRVPEAQALQRYAVKAVRRLAA